MSIDLLQEKIRKRKNPSVIDFGIQWSSLPPHLLEHEGSRVKAYGRFCRELMETLKETVPAVRFGFDAFALLGGEGGERLCRGGKQRGLQEQIAAGCAGQAELRENAEMRMVFFSNIKQRRDFLGVFFRIGQMHARHGGHRADHAGNRRHMKISFHRQSKLLILYHIAGQNTNHENEFGGKHDGEMDRSGA